MVRRARLAAGRDAEYGRALTFNGDVGAELVALGYSIRAAALLSCIAWNTLHDRGDPV